MLLDEITPLRSVGDIRLGAKEDDVTKAVGADFTRTVDDEGDVGIEYGSFGLRFVFWGDYDFKLGCIGIERASASLLGRSLLGNSKEQVKRFVIDRLNASISEADGCIHDDGSVQEWMDVDSQGLSFWFDNDALYLIDVSCDWADTDEPIWL